MKTSDILFTGFAWDSLVEAPSYKGFKVGDEVENFGERAVVLKLREDIGMIILQNKRTGKWGADPLKCVKV